MADKQPIPGYKVIVIGATNSGKTSIIRSYITHEFLETHFATPLPVNHGRPMKDDSGDYRLNIWDTAGSEEWQTMNTSIYHGADAIIYVACYDNSKSLSDLTSTWFDRLTEELDISECVTILAVNKSDLVDKEECVITEEDIEGTRNSLDVNECFRVSALTKTNVDALFDEVGKLLRQREKDKKVDTPAAPPVEVDAGAGQSGGSSCFC
jgi:small GTP-binding protein